MLQTDRRHDPYPFTWEIPLGALVATLALAWSVEVVLLLADGALPAASEENANLVRHSADIQREVVSSVETMLKSAAYIRASGGIGLALALTLAAEPLLRLLFGSGFERAAAPFSILVWTFPLTLLSGHARWILIAAKRGKGRPAAA